jgi:hypothetical protein
MSEHILHQGVDEKDNRKVGLWEVHCEDISGLNWLRIGFEGGYLRRRGQTFRYFKYNNREVSLS